MLKKHLFTISFIGWMMFVTFSSLFSFNDVNTSSLKIPHIDKAVHFTFYFVACILGVMFLRERSAGEMPLKKAIIVMFFITVTFGILMEVLQYNFAIHRTGDVFDGIANTIGSICGALLCKFYFAVNRRLTWKY